MLGSKVLARRLKSSCAGLACIASVGVFLTASSANHGSLPNRNARLRSRLTVLTALSALPLACGYPGLEVVWQNCHSSANSRNCWQLNCGPLSVIKVSGMPWRAKCCFSRLITDFDVVLERHQLPQNCYSNRLSLSNLSHSANTNLHQPWPTALTERSGILYYPFVASGPVSGTSYTG